ncbi:unnamed protein product, partial [Phaeothamnion confervicola]
MDDPRRAGLQAHLLGPCRLLQRLLAAQAATGAAQRPVSIEEDGGGSPGADGGIDASGSGCIDGGGDGGGGGVRRHARRLGYMGHAIMMGQAVIRAQADGGGGGGGGGEGSSSEAGDSGAGSGAGGGENIGGSGLDGIQRDAAGGEGSSSVGGAVNLVVGLVTASKCSAEWEEYVLGHLARATELQSCPLGGFTIPSRDDENQLSTDFPDDALDMDAASMMEQMAQLQMAQHEAAAAAGGDGGDGGGNGGGGGVRGAFAFGNVFPTDPSSGDGGWGQPGGGDNGWANFAEFDDAEPGRGFQAFATDFDSAFSSPPGAPPQPPPRAPLFPAVEAFADFAAFPEPA